MRKTALWLALLAVLGACWLWSWRRQSHYLAACQTQLNEWRQDWAGLRRYQADDAELTRAPGSSRLEAVFLGDSITEFWDLQTFFPGHKYVNRGQQRQTTAQMLIRFRQDVIELQPRAVVVLAGTNDIAGNTGPATLTMIESNLQSMAELAKANGIVVLLGSALPVHDYGPVLATRKRPPDQIAALNRWIQDYCRAGGGYFVDYWATMVDSDGMLRRELSEDGVHPNAQAYGIMAAVAGKALQQALEHR